MPLDPDETFALLTRPDRLRRCILCLEFLVHAWDFAIATDRQVVVSEELSQFVLGLAVKIITPASRSSGGFAAPVAAEALAPVLDRLIAFTGRDPALAHGSAN